MHGVLQLIHHEDAPGILVAQLEEDREQVHEALRPVGLLLQGQREGGALLRRRPVLPLVHGHQTSRGGLTLVRQGEDRLIGADNVILYSSSFYI